MTKMNLEKARELSLNKWTDIRSEFAFNHNRISKACGFCDLAISKKTLDSSAKCANCIPEIKTKCDEMLIFFTNLQVDTDEMIDSIMRVIEGVN